MSYRIKHLLARTSYGQFSSDDFENLNEAIGYLLTQRSSFQFAIEPGKAVRQKTKNVSNSVKKKMKQESRQNLIQYNIDWVNALASSRASLHEKMVLFWHDHFAVHTKIPKSAAIHNNTLRKYAMGKFGDLLHAIAKDPAMLLFLNNQQNKKSAPNENFARELMELYTIGKGHYTEHDIKEAARAFTGWKTNLEGEFLKVKFQHDNGIKQFMGKKGNFDGEDIIDMLLAMEETAFFLTRKFYRFFVHESVNEQIVSQWAKKYYDSGYHTGKLLETIFSSSHFYEQQNIGTKIKSPIEYLLFLMNDFGFQSGDKKATLGIQKILGQVLLSPPNVAGWPDGKAWIDSSSLLYRLNIGPALIMGNEIKVHDKKDFDANQKSILGKKLGQNSTIIRDLRNWKDQTSSNYSRLVQKVIYTDLSARAKQVLAMPLNSGKEAHVELCAKVASLPEYQLI